MRSMRELAAQEGVVEPPLSLRTLATKYSVQTLKALVAAHDIDDFHRHHFGEFGRLGEPTSDVYDQGDGTYVRDFQLGSAIKPLGPGDPPLVGSSKYRVGVTVAAVRCYGTQDSSEDEPYVIVSLISLDPTGEGDELVKTVKLQFESVRENQTFGEMTFIGNFIPVGTGVKVHVGIIDHESGDRDEIAAKINEKMKEAAKQAAASIAGAVASGDVPMAGTFSDVFDNDVVSFLTLTLSQELANLFADDFIDEKVFLISARELPTLATQEGFEASLVPREEQPELPSPIRYNFPKNPRDPYWLFSKGSAGYKVFLLVQVSEIDPPIPLPSR